MCRSKGWTQSQQQQQQQQQKQQQWTETWWTKSKQGRTISCTYPFSHYLKHSAMKYPYTIHARVLSFLSHYTEDSPVHPTLDENYCVYVRQHSIPFTTRNAAQSQHSPTVYNTVCLPLPQYVVRVSNNQLNKAGGKPQNWRHGTSTAQCGSTPQEMTQSSPYGAGVVHLAALFTVLTC